jgi:hypothetical protein
LGSEKKKRGLQSFLLLLQNANGHILFCLFFFLDLFLLTFSLHFSLLTSFLDFALSVAMSLKLTTKVTPDSYHLIFQDHRMIGYGLKAQFRTQFLAGTVFVQSGRRVF